MSVLSEGRGGRTSSHSFIILRNEWIYPAYKLANACSPCSTCWHFLQMAWQKGELGKVAKWQRTDMFGHCLLPPRDTGLLVSVTKACLCECRCCCQWQEGNWVEVTPVWPLQSRFTLCIHFIYVMITRTSMFCLFFSSYNLWPSINLCFKIFSQWACLQMSFLSG